METSKIRLPWCLVAAEPMPPFSELSGELRHHLPPMFNDLVRGLGTHKIISPDWLSLVMFDVHYLKRLMEIGESDADERIEEIVDLLEKE